MSDSNKNIVRRVYEEIWNNRNLNAVEELFAANYMDHDPQSPDFGRGPESARKLLNYYTKAFPDTRFTIEDMVAEGDKVVVRWNVRGTHRGDLGGISPTNRPVSLTGTCTYRITNGKITESYTNWDALGMMQQIGVVQQKATGRAGGA